MRICLSLVALVCCSLLSITASAQPITWERIGDQPVDASGFIAPYLTPDGAFLHAAIALRPEGYYDDGIWWLPAPLDSTARWEQMGEGPRGRTDWVLPLGGDTLLADGIGGNYRSLDGGRTWAGPVFVGHAEAPPLVIPKGLSYAGRIVVPVHNENMVAFSDDRGATWQEGTFLGRDTLDAQALRMALVETGPRAGRLLTGGLSGITYSDDGGETWQPTPEWAHFGIRTNCIAVLSGAALDGGDRVVSLILDRYGPDALTVTVSDDGGDSWRRTALIKEYGTYSACVEVVDLGSGRAAAVMMRGPVYGTEDGGETWTEWGPRPPLDPEENQRAQWALVGPDGRLYVGIEAGGGDDAFDVRSAQPVVAVSNAPEPPQAEDLTLTIEPNPTTQHATARWRQTRAGAARVSVFDARGREVLVLAEGYRQSGEQRAEIGTSALAPGVYVVRIVSPEGTASATLTVGR